MRYLMGVVLILILFVCSSSLETLSLEESIDLALKNNLRLQADLQSVGMADQTFREVRSSILPQLSFNAGMQLNRTEIPSSYIPDRLDIIDGLSDDASDDEKFLATVFNTAFDALLPAKSQEETSYFGQIKLDQVVYLGGKLLSGIRVAGMYSQWEKQKYELSRREVTFQTISSYYQGILLMNVVELNREAFELAEKHYLRVVSMHEQGLVSEFDKIRAELEVLKLEPQLQEAVNNYSLWIESFRKHIGWDGFNGTTSGVIEEPQPFSPSLENAIATGKEQRIEIYLSGTYRDMLEIAYGAEKGNYLPNVFLSAEINKFSNAGEFQIKPNDFGTSYQVMLGMQLPIFTGFGNSAKKAKARHEYKRASMEHYDAVDKIELDIINSWYNLNHAKANHLAHQKRLELASRALAIANTRYDNQIGINLEVLDSQLEYKAAHLSHLQSIYSIIIAQTTLRKAMGTDLY